MYLARLFESKLRESAKRGNPLALAITGEKPRSPHWRTVETSWLKAHGQSAACRGIIRLQVHHVRPFHSHPELELADGTGRFCQIRDPRTGHYLTNLVTLCMAKGCECHLRIGHGGSFRTSNPNVLTDAAEMRAHPARAPLIYTRAIAAAVRGIA